MDTYKATVVNSTKTKEVTVQADTLAFAHYLALEKAQELDPNNTNLAVGIPIKYTYL